MKQQRLKFSDKSHVIFAYGSNMNRRQMAMRCPSARPIGVARLEGYRLAFAGQSPRWGGGVATVVPARRGSVTGLLWRLSPDDLERLDGFEGYPSVYDRAPVIVRTGRDGQIWCHTYVKNATERPASPSEEYLRTILDGYHAAGVKPPAQLKNLFAEVSDVVFP